MEVNTYCAGSFGLNEINFIKCLVVWLEGSGPSGACVSLGSPEKQNQYDGWPSVHVCTYVFVCIYVCVYVIYYKELAYMVVEAEESRDLQLAGWGPGRADD